MHVREPALHLVRGYVASKLAGVGCEVGCLVRCLVRCLVGCIAGCMVLGLCCDGVGDGSMIHKVSIF